MASITTSLKVGGDHQQQQHTTSLPRVVTQSHFGQFVRGYHRGSLSKTSSHSGRWKTRYFKPNSWTCCESRLKSSAECTANTWNQWDCCKQREGELTCLSNEWKEWSCCHDRSESNMQCAKDWVSCLFGSFY